MTGSNPETREREQDGGIVLSCVSTMYRSEKFLAEFVDRLDKSAKTQNVKYEIILVDDGSPDASLQKAQELLTTYSNLKVVELSRNFGHHHAILAGLSVAKGQWVFFVDCDLEEPPELLQQFATLVSQQPHVDVFYGVHLQEHKSRRRQFSSRIFWRLIGAVSEVPIPSNIANVRLMRRSFVLALLSMPDQNVFLGGMFAWPGFRQQGVEIERTPRADTSYTWRNRMRLAAKAAIAFSDWPLYFVFFLGITLTITSVIVGLIFAINKAVNQQAVLDGFTSIIISIWIIGGINLGCIGIVGFYVAHIYKQARQRPRFIIRNTYESSEIR